MNTLDNLHSALDNAEYYLAEAEMHYDRTGSDIGADAIKAWSAEVQKLNQQIKDVEQCIL